MAVEILVRKQVSKDLESVVPKKSLKKIAQKLLNDLEYSDSELSVLVTDDAEMQELNNGYRGKNETTDVLSFRLAEAESGEIAEDILGDVIISLPRAALQAGEMQRTPGEEVLFLLIHGVLHLLGYDHENVSEEEANRMRLTESKYFAQYRQLLQ